MKLNQIVFLLMALGLAAYGVRADGECHWAFDPNLDEPDEDSAADSGSDYPSTWAWQFWYRADAMEITGNMSADCYRCTTTLSKAGSGNGTYTVMRVAVCDDPVEDIEGTARNEFKAYAEIDDDSYARAVGRKRIKAAKMSLDCDCRGGVEATSDGPGSGSSGESSVTIGGVSATLYWSEAGFESRVFQDTDGGTGGTTIETITCQTNLELALSVGWYDDSGEASLTNSKAELIVWGTCDGECGLIQQMDIYSSY